MFIRDFASKRMLSLLALSFFVACSSNKKSAEKEDDDAFLADDTTSEGQETPVTEDIPDTASDGQAVSSDSSASDTLELQDSDTVKVAKVAAPSSASSKAAAVKTTPFEKDSFMMNAFYFVQSAQDDYSGLSNKFYGRPDRAELLKKWNNSKSPRVGNIIYYNSPFRHSDNAQMLSFAEDFGAANGQLATEEGDTLRSIAKRIYGDERAWRILASMNPQISDPNAVAPGTQLIFQPQVDTAAKLQEFVNNGNAAQAAQANNSEQSATAGQSEQPAQTAQADSEQGNLGDSELGTSDDGINLQDEIAEGSAENKIPTASSKKKNMPLIAGLVIMLAALVYLVMKRRKARAG